MAKQLETMKAGTRVTAVRLTSAVGSQVNVDLKYPGILIADLPAGYTHALIRFDDGYTGLVIRALVEATGEEMRIIPEALRVWRNQYRRSWPVLRYLDPEFEIDPEAAARKKQMRWVVGFSSGYLEYDYQLSGFEGHRVNITEDFAKRLLGERVRNVANKMFVIVDVTYLKTTDGKDDLSAPRTAVIVEQWDSQWRLWVFCSKE